MKTDILSMTPQEIATFMAELKQPGYRGEQIFGWLHKKNVRSFAEMENLPLSLRTILEENCRISTVTPVEAHVSNRDGTTKFLSAIHNDSSDTTLIEYVLMTYKHGNSVCISTQAGCRMGCKFCASAENGLDRNLTAGEYCAQIYNVEQQLNDQKGSANAAKPASAPGQTRDLRSIVLMGCGEPLDNYDATLRFIELITHPKGMNIGQRHITVSTCGLVPQIYELAKERLQVTLAISLHAPTDDIRESLMPIAKVHPLGKLIPACRNYGETTRRRITFEYALAKGVNSSPSHALELVKLLKGLLCHVNLIPINKARGQFTPATREEIATFASILDENRIPATIRRSLGGDVKAACGQLRAGRMDGCGQSKYGGV